MFVFRAFPFPHAMQIRPSFRKEPVKAVKHRVQELLDPSERTVRQFMRTVVAPTDALEPAMRELSTEELAGTATRLRARLADGARPARARTFKGLEAPFRFS